MIRVRKLEAAEKQTKTAIELFFANEDLVSAHTLASAALQIVYDLAKDDGTKIAGFAMHPKKKDDDDFVKEHLRLFRLPANFFKHATDGADEVEFHENLTAAIIFEAMSGIQMQGITLEDNPHYLLFEIWMAINYPASYATNGGLDFIRLAAKFHEEKKSYFFQELVKAKKDHTRMEKWMGV